MADLPSDFWGGWIVTITVASFIALLWLVIDVYRSGPDKNEDLVWDETLREGAKPAPIWWFWFILALMTISVIYVMLYPGLGQWRGALGWSMGSRIAERHVDYESEFGDVRRSLLRQPLAALAESEAAMTSAWHVFNNHCSSCHGRDAAGQAKTFPDLRDSAWQWGADESQIVATIHSGRQAAMPGWSTVVGQEGSRSSRTTCWPSRAAITPTRRPRAAHCSSSTAWPAMGPAAKAIRCWGRQR